MPTNVLLVEYEPRYIERVQQFLAGERDVHLEIARDGTEAGAAVARNQPDLVLISAVLPKVSTPTVIADMRKQPGMDKVFFLILMSGFKGKDKTKEAERMGANDILEKPFTREDLLPYVERVAQPSVRSLSKQALKSVNSVAAAPGSNPGNETVAIRVPRPDSAPGGPPAGEGQLTSADIFSDMIDDLGGNEAGAAPPQQAAPAAAPAPAAAAAAAPPPPRPAAPAQSAAQKKSDDELEKKLEQTLSGIMPAGARKPAAAKPAKRAVDEDTGDRLLSETLSGSGLDASSIRRARAATQGAPPVPVPVAPAPSGPAPVPALSAAAAVPAPAPAAAPAAAPAPAPVAAPAPAPAPVAAPAPAAVAPAAVPVPPPPAPRPAAPPPPAPAAAPTPAPSPAAPAARPEPAAARPEPRPGPTRAAMEPREFGQYALKEKIATGGMAEVWKARMRGVEGFQKDVAIKKILPHLSDNHDFITMFIDEAKLAAQLNHNNIIHIYDLGKIADSYYIAMEYVDGMDLKTILRECRNRSFELPIELAIFVAAKIASALDYAHRKRDFEDRELGLVHRDVSPQNVLFSYEGDIKLCDFGIAKAASKASHTQHGALKGKLQYMSPEQAWGKRIDKRSDIFSLGAVLYEMLTGQKVFTGDSEIGVLEQVREASFTPPEQINTEISPELAAVVRKALGKSPDDRYQSAHDMARDLEGLLYSYKPAPNSADLAIFMHRLFSEKLEGDEPAAAEPWSSPTPPLAARPEPPPPAPVVVVKAAPAPAAPSPAARPEPRAAEPRPAAVAHLPAAAPAPAPPPPQEPRVLNAPSFGVGMVPMREDTATGMMVPSEKSKMPLFIGIAAAAVVAIVLGWVLTRPKQGPQTATATGSPAPSAAVSPASPGDLPASPAAAAGMAIPSPSPSPRAGESEEERKARLDEEVRKRLEDERKRQAAALASASPTPERPSPSPPAPVAAPPSVAPAPVQVAASPSPEPPAAIPEPEPAPAAAAPAVRVGDLVEPGPGVVEPKMLSFTKPAYPPLARARSVSGTVIVRVLVSEGGRVVETKLLRGVAQNVGINEAALSAVQKATFKPATKDGVAVKMWTTMSVPFIL